MMEKKYKIVLIGDTRVGKTSIVNKRIDPEYSLTSRSTIGCSCSEIKQDNKVISVWDTAGQEMYRSLVPSYFRNTDAAFVVYDPTDEMSYKSVEFWYDIAMKSIDHEIPFYIVENKIDLDDKAKINIGEARSLAEKLNMHYFRVSAKTGEGIRELFMDAINKIESNATAVVTTLKGLKISLDSSKEKRSCC